VQACLQGNYQRSEGFFLAFHQRLEEKETVLVAARDPNRFRSTQRFVLLGLVLAISLGVIFVLHKVYAKITREEALPSSYSMCSTGLSYYFLLT
jgi:hypothetical protein